MTRSATDFFNDAAQGDSHAAFKWKDQPIGTKLVGTILDDPKPIIRPNIDKTKPDEEQLPINLDTDGTEAGYRTLWVRKGFLASAIKDATDEAGVGGIAKGGKLGVELTELRDTGKPQPAYVFEAKYQPPAAPETNVDDIF